MSVYILPGNISKLEETIKGSLFITKKKTIYDIALKDEREMKRFYKKNCEHKTAVEQEIIKET